MIGETLGHYRVEALLGSGGMGVVYRARDERLHRTVAIKLVGTEGGGSRPEDRASLLDEARAASQLNHPHICTVYEVGELGERAYIAMEFVAGRPLSQMLPPGGLPAETVIRFAAQIASAIAHAHERGVVHRDLKTANIVVNDETGVKVLDFGLARRIDPVGSDIATQSGRTGAKDGALTGTLAYIAPEVLLGQPADARSDIWALGVVIYEMATGELPFTGRNQFDVTAAILRSPPRAFPPHVPPILRAIVLHCLSKEPAQRYQRAGEARAALEAVQSDVFQAGPVVSARRTRTLLAVVGGAVIIAATAAGWIYFRPDPWHFGAAGGRLSRIVSSETVTYDPAISLDGRMLAYAADHSNGRVDLFTSRVAGGARVQLTDDAAREGAPRFSPDGERIAFTRVDSAGGLVEIRVVPALGGEVVATIAGAAYPAWSPDGRRLAYLKRLEGGTKTALTTSALDGSEARTLMTSDSVYPFLRYPAWSPDGRQIAVVRGSGGVAGEIWLVAADGGEPRKAIEEPASVYSDSPVFTPDGRGIVHTSNRGGATNIWFLPLAGGDPVRLTTGPGPDESPSVSSAGAVAFVNSRWRNTLDVYDLTTGDVRSLLSHSPFLWSPAVSPDGREIAFSRSEEDGAWHIWTMPAGGGTPRRLTSGDAGEVYPRFTPDGRFITFHTWGAPRRIGRVPAGGGALELLPFEQSSFADVSPDGRWVAFARADADVERIYVGPLGGGEARMLTASPGAVPRWSPDGSLIAFSANRGYSGGLFLIRPDGTGERRLTNDGGWPVWWPDGRQIGYLTVKADGNQQIRIVTLDGASRGLDTVKLAGTNHPFSIFRDGIRLVTSNAVHISDEIWILERGRQPGPL